MITRSRSRKATGTTEAVGNSDGGGPCCVAARGLVRSVSEGGGKSIVWERRSRSDSPRLCLICVMGRSVVKPLPVGPLSASLLEGPASAWKSASSLSRGRPRFLCGTSLHESFDCISTRPLHKHKRVIIPVYQSQHNDCTAAGHRSSNEHVCSFRRH